MLIATCKPYKPYARNAGESRSTEVDYDNTMKLVSANDSYLKSFFKESYGKFASGFTGASQRNHLVKTWMALLSCDEERAWDVCFNGLQQEQRNWGQGEKPAEATDQKPSPSQESALSSQDGSIDGEIKRMKTIREIRAETQREVSSTLIYHFEQRLQEFLFGAAQLPALNSDSVPLLSGPDRNFLNLVVTSAFLV